MYTIKSWVCNFVCEYVLGFLTLMYSLTFSLRTMVTWSQGWLASHSQPNLTSCCCPLRWPRAHRPARLPCSASSSVWPGCWWRRHWRTPWPTSRHSSTSWATHIDAMPMWWGIFDAVVQIYHGGWMVSVMPWEWCTERKMFEPHDPPHGVRNRIGVLNPRNLNLIP